MDHFSRCLYCVILTLSLWTMLCTRNTTGFAAFRMASTACSWLASRRSTPPTCLTHIHTHTQCLRSLLDSVSRCVAQNLPERCHSVYRQYTCLSKNALTEFVVSFIRHNDFKKSSWKQKIAQTVQWMVTSSVDSFIEYKNQFSVSQQCKKHCNMLHI